MAPAPHDRGSECAARRAEIAKQPAIQDGAPALALEGVTYLADGLPIEYFVDIDRGDRTRFEGELFRSSPASAG